MPSRLPLPTLLSFALVAFTIEADNESERRIPHRTTRHGKSAARGLWLTSMAMWFNCMRWVPEQGITAREVERLARTKTNWDGMRRWGYICFEPSPGDDRPKPPPSSLLVRATARGRFVHEVWQAVLPEIEARWRERFGKKAIGQLRAALAVMVGHQSPYLPDCMPILKYGLVSEAPKPQKAEAARSDLASLPLPALLARVLLAFALEFERDSAVSLAICANILRVIDDPGTAVRELPERSGVSREAIAMALGFLTKRGCVKVQAPAQGSPFKVVRLTPKGIIVQDAASKLLAEIEHRWMERYGNPALETLRKALEPLVADGTLGHSPLYRGLAPHPECWRAQLPQSLTLPHYPMVLHRGGYPDGS